MEIVHCIGDHPIPQDCFERDKTAISNRKSDSVCGADEISSTGFECNICLDMVCDPVVTLCGHLYCWPCIYTWLVLQDASAQNPQQKQNKKQCPVCKAEVSDTTLIPLFCRGNVPSLTPKNQDPHLNVVVPSRPLGPASGVPSPSRSSTATSSPRAAHQSSDQINVPGSGLSYYSPLEDYFRTSVFHPSVRSRSIIYTIIAMFAELILARIFGESVANLYGPYPNILDGSGNSRFRRRIVQADQSLNRIWFFLFCCIMFFLLLF